MDRNSADRFRFTYCQIVNRKLPLTNLETDTCKRRNDVRKTPKLEPQTQLMINSCELHMAPVRFQAHDSAD